MSNKAIRPSSMIISHRHRFIFIKNRKTAGTSIEKALTTICGPDDVITPFRVNMPLGGDLATEARNFDGSFNPIREVISCSSPLEAARAVRDFIERPKFYNHMRASSVRARVPQNVWRSYYKFCFERNSWDKTASFYSWVNKIEKNKPSFADYLRNAGANQTNDQAFASDWVRYTDRSGVIVDDIFDYSDINAGLRIALERIGVAEADAVIDAIPALNSGVRAPREDTQYTPELSAIVERAFSREINHFGYECPPQLIA